MKDKVSWLIMGTGVLGCVILFFYVWTNGFQEWPL